MESDGCWDLCERERGLSCERNPKLDNRHNHPLAANLVIVAAASTADAEDRCGACADAWWIVSHLYFGLASLEFLLCHLNSSLTIKHAEIGS